MPLVLRAEEGRTTTLTLNRPEKLNSLTTAMFVELDAHLAAIEEAGETVGCVVLRGAGRCFSAGRDLGDVDDAEPLPRPNFHAHVVQRLADLPQPVIAAVHGHCYTGALELALAADILVAADSAKFADTHGKWALTPLWGMSQRLPRRIGAAKALELMLTSRTVDGAEAAQIGLANVCVAEGALDAAVAALAEQINANSWHSNGAAKRLIRGTDGLPLAQGLAHEVFYSEGHGPDMAERLAAYAGRRSKPS